MTRLYANLRRIISVLRRIITLAACWPLWLPAHDFWIEPTTLRGVPGEEIGIVLRVGEALSGETVPYINQWFSDYRVVTPSGPEPVDAILGDDPAGTFTPGEPGQYLIGYRSTRDFVEMDPKKFIEYLRAEGLEWVERRRVDEGEDEAPARELYSRCAKSLLEIGDGGLRDAWRLNLGYTLELLPERDPYRLAPGDTLPVRLEYLGEPLAGILVIAFRRDAPDGRIERRSDAAGRVELPLDGAGLWLIKAVHIIRTRPNHRQAEWESFWASLTFELPAAAAD